MFLDGLHHIIKLDLGGACPAVVDDGLPVRAIPAVHCGTERHLKLGPQSQAPHPRNKSAALTPAADQEVITVQL